MRGADHVVDGEAQRVLVVGVAVDAQVGGVPGGVPRRPVPPQQLVVAHVSGTLQGPPRDLRRRHLGARGNDRGEPVHGGRVARLETTADHVARLLRRARDGRARRRIGRHRKHVPAAVAAARARDQTGRIVEHFELGLFGRAARVRHADRALPDERPGEVLGRRLRARGHELAVGQRGEPRGAHAHAAAAAQPLPPPAVDDAVAHVEHPLVVHDLAVREGQGAAGHHEAKAGPVGRRDRLAEGRIAGPVAVDAGDEGGRRGDRRALLERAARAGLAVGDREPRLDLALTERIEALDLEPPGGVPRRLGEAPLRDDLSHGQLVVKDVEEPDRAAAGVEHRRGHAGRLLADAHVHGPAELGDEHRRVGALAVGDGPERVAQHEQVLRLAATSRDQPSRDRVHGVALAGEADVDVPHVAGDRGVREAGLATQFARQFHALREAAVEADAAQALVHSLLQIGDRRSRRLRPVRHQVDREAVEVIPDERDVEPGGRQPLVHGLGRGLKQFLLEGGGLPALQQPGAGRPDHVDLGAPGEVEEQAALDARTRAQLRVDVADVCAADDGDVDAERREPLHAAAHRGGVGVAARHRGAVPREADDGELTVEHALQLLVARAVVLRSRLDLVARHRPTILPHARLSCTGTVHLPSCHDGPR